MAAPEKKFIIGTRGSDLALCQAKMVREALAREFPRLVVETRIIKTTGDERTDIKLTDFHTENIVDKGIFTKELEVDLAAGRIDLAVHSAKDVPTELDAGFDLAGYLPREDVDDVLISPQPLPDGLASLKSGARVATGSVRREAQLLYLRKDLKVVDIRGNVPTRMSKLLDPANGFDGMVLARAGLKRLNYAVDGDCEHEGKRVHLAMLSAPDFLPAAGQGAVGLEVRADDERALSMVEAIADKETGQRLKVERAFLALLQAGCHTPVGIHTKIDGLKMEVEARVFADEDLTLPPKHAVCSGSACAPEVLAHTIMDHLKYED